MIREIPWNGLREIPQKGLREIPLNGLQEIPLNGFLGNNHKKISSPCPATVSVFIPEISQLRIFPGKFSRKSPISVDIFTGFSCERFLGISADSWERLMLLKINKRGFSPHRYRKKGLRGTFIIWTFYSLNGMSLKNMSTVPLRQIRYLQFKNYI